MKKILYSGFVALAISISFVQQAGASSGDARSFALGGASTGLSNDAFTVLHNPAGMVNLKWGSFILPLSPSLYTTNNLGWSNFINKTVSTATFAGIFDEMKKTNNASIKIDNTSIIPIFGFSGKPFTGLNVLGQPVAFGLNVWAKAQADVNLDISSGMLTIANELVNAGTEGLNISKQLSDSSTQLNGILQKFNELSPKFSSLTSSASLTNMDSVAKDLKDMQSSTLTPLITEGKTTIDSFKTKFNR